MDKIKDCGSATSCLRLIIGVLCACGTLLSFYAYHVEMSKERDINYTAMCDIDKHMSCTAVFSSKYGKGFGFIGRIFGRYSVLNQPNSVYGIIFYTAFFPLGEVPSVAVSKLLITLAILSNLCSFYLAFILIFILHDFCIICVTTYIINFFLLVCSIFRHRLHTIKDAAKKAT